MSKTTDSRVLIHVQHLLGVGHLQRALLLAASLRDQGLEVLLVSGGLPTSLPVPGGVNFEQLAPLYSADGSFQHLLDEQGRPIDDAWRNARRDRLLAVYRAYAPQALITETFPFGRRMLRFELLPLLEASRGGCRLRVASVRDILQPRSRREREQETCDLLNACYQRVLVHGDPRIARLDESFGLASEIADKIAYSGYIGVARAPIAQRGDGQDEVVVSAGGSATGLRLLQTALRARPRSPCAGLRWRLLVSPAIDEQDFNRLRREADAGIVVERNRPDFSALLRRARISVSQAGYNTMTDLLGSDTAAVVVPFAQHREREQTLRAQALHRQRRVIALAESELDEESLAQAMRAALRLDTGLAVDLDGAAHSAGLVKSWLDSTVEAQ